MDKPHKDTDYVSSRDRSKHSKSNRKSAYSDAAGLDGFDNENDSAVHLCKLYHDFCLRESLNERTIQVCLTQLDQMIVSRTGPPLGESEIIVTQPSVVIQPPVPAPEQTSPPIPPPEPKPKVNKRKEPPTVKSRPSKHPKPMKPLNNVPTKKTRPPRNATKPIEKPSPPPEPIISEPPPDLIPVEYKVAALVRKPDEWILAVVTKQHPEKNKYEVMDADDADEEDERKRYLLPKSSIIPLPTADNSAKGFVKQYEFQKDSPVLAIFPGTTCFYKASIVSVPRGRRKVGEYILRFEDDEDEQGNTPTRKVSAQYVLPRTI